LAALDELERIIRSR